MSLLLARCLVEKASVEEVALTLSRVLYPNNGTGRLIRICWWEQQIRRVAPDLLDTYLKAVVSLRERGELGSADLQTRSTSDCGYEEIHATIDSLMESIKNNQSPHSVLALIALVSACTGQSLECLKEQVSSNSDKPDVHCNYDQFVSVLENMWNAKWSLARTELVRCIQGYVNDQRSDEPDLGSYYLACGNEKQLVSYSHYDIALWVITLGLLFYDDSQSTVCWNTYVQLLTKLCCNMPEWTIFVHDIVDGEHSTVVLSMVQAWELAIQFDLFLSPYYRDIVLEYVAARASWVVINTTSVCWSLLWDLLPITTTMRPQSTETQCLNKRLLEIINAHDQNVEYYINCETGQIAPKSRSSLIESLRALDSDLSELLRVVEKCNWNNPQEVLPQ